MAKIRRENWRNKYYYVVRSDKGTILSYKKVKGSKSSLKEQKETFSKNKTLRTGFKVRRQISIKKDNQTLEGKNFKVLVGKKKTSKLISVRYKVEFDDKIYYGNSNIKETSVAKAKKEAYENMLKAIGKEYFDVSDSKKGEEKIDEFEKEPTFEVYNYYL